MALLSQTTTGSRVAVMWTLVLASWPLLTSDTSLSPDRRMRSSRPRNTRPLTPAAFPSGTNRASSAPAAAAAFQKPGKKLRPTEHAPSRHPDCSQ